MAARPKITVVGAGNVGASVAQYAVEKELGDVVLVDVVEGIPQGKALDLAQAGPIHRYDASIIVNRVLESKDYNFGFDAATGDYGDMVKAGIIDPAKVTRTALQNAGSIAALLLTTDALVAEIPEKKKGPAMPQGGGMDDMY